MTPPDVVHVFGYGSLVNRRARRQDLEAKPAVVCGWRRMWGHCVATENGNVCALTITPEARATVAGVVVLEQRNNLAALDAREIGYKRVSVSLAVEPASDPANREAGEAFTYTSASEACKRGSREFPIWRSYLECVLAGFLDLGGEEAARNFVLSTDGWDTPLLDDRTAPKYMRSILLPTDIQDEVDRLILSYGLDRAEFTESSRAMRDIPLL
jgi:cation transport protein ChaC